MKHPPLSLLVISADEKIQDAVKSAFSSDDYKVTSRTESIDELNGHAASVLKNQSVVLFDAGMDGFADDTTTRDFCDAKAAGAHIYALAGDDMPLAKTRELRRLGVEDVLPRDAFKEEVVPQIEALRIRREAQLPAIWTGHAQMGKVIAVAQSRGGVGASTLAANLANELQAKRGLLKKSPTASVALVDLDFQFGSQAALLDVDESDALWSMAMEEILPDAAFLEGAMTKADCGVTVLSAPARFGPLTALDPDQIAAIIDVLQNSYDYVVVDLPRALVEWISPVLAKANRLILVTDVTVPSVRSARKLMDFYLGENPGLDIQLVVSMEKKPLILAAHHRAAVDLLKKKFSYWIPRDDKAAREMLDVGAPLESVAPRSPMARAIHRMALDTIKELPRRAVAGVHA